MPKSLKTVFRLVGALLLLGVIVAIMAAPSPPLRKHAERKEVRLWHMWSGEWKDVIDGIVAEYNRSQDVYEVVPLSLPSGAQSKLQMGIAGGDPPDLMVEWSPILPTWAEAGLLQRLDELMTPEEKARYDEQAYPIVKRVGGYQGHIYGLAVGLNLTACYVRKDFLKEAGVDPETWVPKTIEELEEVGKRLDRFDKNGNLTRIGFNPPNFKSVVSAFRGGFWDWEQDGKGGLMIDTPQNVEALTHIVDQRKRLGFDSVLRFQSGQGSDFGGAWAFIQGAYGITIDGQWRVEQLRKYAPQVPYRVFPLPPPKGGRELAQMTGGNFIIIPKGAKNVPGAWAFVKWWNGLTDPSTAADPFALMAQMPPSSGVAESPKYAKYLQENPEFAKFVAMLPSPHIHPLPPVAIQQFLNDKIASAEDAALRGTLTPKAALAKAQREVEDELARRKKLGYRE
ncbi:MAG: ABC transporter substrate-binding protein [Fimbriimonas sp.]